MRHKKWLLAITVAAAIGALSKAESSPQSEDPDKELLEAIRSSLELDTEARYFAAYTDLNGDGGKEAVVYFIGPRICGSGGCHTAIFSPLEEGKSYRLVT